mmetsp:Transcript_22834/g.52865  ORF Transcript_22834/g.52865 Transcript_22834/m.52865 type:complete len:97 (-) Transcript_22834:3022-3312(-)
MDYGIDPNAHVFLGGNLGLSKSEEKVGTGCATRFLENDAFGDSNHGRLDYPHVIHTVDARDCDGCVMYGWSLAVYDGFFNSFFRSICQNVATEHPL